METPGNGGPGQCPGWSREAPWTSPGRELPVQDPPGTAPRHW